MNNDKLPQNNDPISNNAQPDPVHPSENPGLANELNEIIESGQYSEGSPALDNTAEHQLAVEELVAGKNERLDSATKRAQLRTQALAELGGDSGIISASQSEIEQKMVEIEQRES